MNNKSIKDNKLEFMKTFINKKVLCHTDYSTKIIKNNFYRIVDVFGGFYTYIILENGNLLTLEQFHEYFTFKTIKEVRKEKIKKLLNN